MAKIKLPLKLKDNQSGLIQLNKDSDKQAVYICLNDLREHIAQVNILAFDNKHLEIDERNGNELVVSLNKNAHDQWTATTGNYVGELTVGQQRFVVESRFGQTLLKRMLNFANGVFLSDVDVLPQQKDAAPPPIGKLILRYLFVQSLERAHVLGLPKAYVGVQDDSLARLRGRINLPRYIRQAIPFRGKIPSVSREQKAVQPIAAVLLKAVQIIKKDLRIKPSTPKNGQHTKETEYPMAHIRGVIHHLREVNVGVRWSRDLIDEAKNHKVLINPIFAPYKKTLEYAELIIQTDSLEKSDHGNEYPYFGLMVNVAELFEIYVRKLLQRAFLDWHIHSPRIKLHCGTFFQRKIIPDIVMERGNDVVVFDTKYKRMQFARRSLLGAGDLDRDDFFQINTYMAFYAQHLGKNLLGGGLLYPIEADYPKESAWLQDSWLGQNKTPFFIVDGLVLGAEVTESIKLSRAEDEFIGRISNLLEKTATQRGRFII